MDTTITTSEKRSLTDRKSGKIIYWIATVWLALGMLSSGIVQLLRVEGEIEFILNLGYPVYFLTILGIWKMLGVITVLIPGFPLVKEWAYAGFFFVMSGAVFSHLASGDGAKEFFGIFEHDDLIGHNFQRIKTFL